MKPCDFPYSAKHVYFILNVFLSENAEWVLPFLLFSGPQDMDCVWTAAKIYWMRGWLQILTGDRACTNSKFKSTHVLNTKFSFQRILSQNFKIELASLKCKLLRKEIFFFFSKKAPYLIPEKSNVASLKLARNNELGSWKVQITIHIQDSILRKRNFSEGLSVNLGCHNELWIP